MNFSIAIMHVILFTIEYVFLRQLALKFSCKENLGISDKLAYKPYRLTWEEVW